MKSLLRSSMVNAAGYACAKLMVLVVLKMATRFSFKILNDLKKGESSARRQLFEFLAKMQV